MDPSDQKTYHRRFPHSVIDQISAFELTHEPFLSFTRPGNTTSDRFLLFTWKQEGNVKLQNFRGISKPSAQNASWEQPNTTS